MLLVELDGIAGRSRTTLPRSTGSAATCGACEVRVARDEAERALLWKGRKAAFAAMGRISPDYYVQDGVIPRTKLPEVLRRIASSRGSTACASATSSTRATATCTRSCSTTPRKGERRRA